MTRSKVDTRAPVALKPERQLDRLTTALRLIVAIPILVVSGLLTGQIMSDGGSKSTEHEIVIGGAAVLSPLVLMLVFRQKNPRWWFHWNLTSYPPFSLA